MPSSRILARDLHDARPEPLDEYDRQLERRREATRATADGGARRRQTTARRTAPLTAGAVLLASAMTLLTAPVAEAVGSALGR